MTDLFSQAFFNTVNESGGDLKKSIDKAFNQNELVLGIYARSATKTMTVSMVYKKFLEFTRLTNTPKVSIGRAMTDLKNAGKLIKTEHMAMGMYGKKEYYYRLK